MITVALVPATEQMQNAVIEQSGVGVAASDTGGSVDIGVCTA